MPYFFKLLFNRSDHLIDKRHALGKPKNQVQGTVQSFASHVPLEGICYPCALSESQPYHVPLKLEKDLELHFALIIITFGDRATVQANKMKAFGSHSLCLCHP